MHALISRCLNNYGVLMPLKTIAFLCAMCIVWNLNSQSRFGATLADSALTLTRQAVHYDPSYFRIAYPNGDVPVNRGVCTDVVIRAYRKLGIDLQERVHNDMVRHFDSYPRKWGLNKPDPNIDHRRVPNLMAFFERHGDTLEITHNPADYHPGDIVCWRLEAGELHIGIVSRLRSDDNQRYLIIHNIGSGQTADDMLFHYPIIGHYAYENF
jgi:hypothetical protein